jgi:hypothetical protein
MNSEMELMLSGLTRLLEDKEAVAAVARYCTKCVETRLVVNANLNPLDPAGQASILRNQGFLNCFHGFIKGMEDMRDELLEAKKDEKRANT